MVLLKTIDVLLYMHKTAFTFLSIDYMECFDLSLSAQSKNQNTKQDNFVSQLVETSFAFKCELKSIDLKSSPIKIEVDSKNTLFDKDDCNSLRKVWYSEQRFADSKGQFTPFVKSLQWAHEQEWRLFRELDESYVYMPCLTEIYLGINFDFCDINRIQTAIQQNRRNINVYLVHPKPNIYEFECIPVQFN